MQTFDVRSNPPETLETSPPTQPWEWLDEGTVRFTLDGDIPSQRSLDYRRRIAVSAARRLADRVVPGGVATDPVDVTVRGAVVAADPTDVEVSLLRIGPTLALASVHFIAPGQPRTEVLVTFARP